MGFADFFIERSRFAVVLSLIVALVGAMAMLRLPIAQYPEVVPPTIVVSAQYPGADPRVIAETVAAPIEQAVNWVERMLYMSSQSTADGQIQLTITYEIDTDLDIVPKNGRGARRAPPRGDRRSVGSIGGRGPVCVRLRTPRRNPMQAMRCGTRRKGRGSHIPATIDHVIARLPDER